MLPSAVCWRQPGSGRGAVPAPREDGRPHRPGSAWLITLVFCAAFATALVLRAEMLAAASHKHQPPTKQAVDDARYLVLTGNRNTVTVVGSQTAANGSATIAGSAEQAKPWNETWWQLIVGLATVIAAVAAVLQLYGWVLWK